MARRNLKPGTFAFIPTALHADPDLRKMALRVGGVLAASADKDGRCWLSTETMADKLQCARGLVLDGLAQLVKRGHIQRQERPGRSSIYTLNFREPAIFVGARPAKGDRKNRSGQTGGVDRKNRSGQEASPDRFFQSAPDRFFEEPDQNNRSPLTGLTGHDQYISVESDQDDDEAERAHARETSASSAAPDDFSDEGQALLIFDELAGKLGWQRAGRLTSDERKAMTARLQEADGLAGWRLAMEKAEASNYLRKTKPGLPFFLNEDYFARLMRGRYDPENDPEPRGLEAWVAVYEKMGGRGNGMAGDVPSEVEREEPAAPDRPTRTPEQQRRLRRLSEDTVAIADAVGRTFNYVKEQLQSWRAGLVDGGLDFDAATFLLADLARETPKTETALEWMTEKVAERLQAKASA